MTAVDRLKADPFAFYAQAMLGLRPLDPVDADHSAAWKGTAVHEVLEQWLARGRLRPRRLMDRAPSAVAGEAIHPMLRALWQPRLIEAIRWIAEQERANRADGPRARSPPKPRARPRSAGSRFTARPTASTGSPTAALAIIDYKTGKAPSARRRSMPASRCSSACSG